MTDIHEQLHGFPHFDLQKLKKEWSTLGAQKLREKIEALNKLAASLQEIDLHRSTVAGGKLNDRWIDRLTMGRLMQFVPGAISILKEIVQILEKQANSDSTKPTE